MSDPFARTVEAFLQGKTREYKSAKGRFSTRDGYFYSYAMPIAWRRPRDKMIEVLNVQRAPSVTTARHLERLRTALINGSAILEEVYALGAPVCRRCGTRHGAGDYPTYEPRPSASFGQQRRSRKCFTDAKTVCEVRQAITAATADMELVAQRAAARNLIAVGVINHAAARDLGLPFVLGYARVNPHALTPDDVGDRSLFVDPLVAEVFAVSGVNQRVKRATLKRMKTDPEFRKAVEALIVAPGLLRSFLVNYAKEQLS